MGETADEVQKKTLTHGIEPTTVDRKSVNRSTNDPITILRDTENVYIPTERIRPEDLLGSWCGKADITSIPYAIPLQKSRL